MTTYEFICENIDKTTRTYTRPPKRKKDLIGLPFPFTSPCISGIFQEMYYWDTYFTNKGFLRLGKREQAVNNVRNFIFLLYNYGKIPNGNRMDFLNRSQPPFLGYMLEDLILSDSGEQDISVEQAFKALEAEYSFWQTKRGCENGMNRYYNDLDERELKKKKHVRSYKRRTGIKLSYTVESARNILSECESGWDFSPRFNSECTSYNPVDLNCLLYKDELLLSDWAKILGYKDKSKAYEAAADARKEQIISKMLAGDFYYDYNFKNNKCSDVLSCAALFPFFVGIDKDPEKFKKALNRLEKEFGLVACDYSLNNFQWSAPNSWAPLNYIAFCSALKLGLKDDAKRIAEKYLKAVDLLFEKTGQLWEKYNANDGSIDKESEYGTPAMLGWCSGVYLEFYHFINK